MTSVLLIGGFLDGCRVPYVPCEEMTIPETSITPFGNAEPQLIRDVKYVKHELDGWSEPFVFVDDSVEVTDQLLRRHILPL
ncbi:hypothetical protein PshuTeo1_38090 [Pseudomonas hunanensis]|nr:hypothetical protein PshuTeo1_38090 [Pseudomonas hunanensis]